MLIGLILVLFNGPDLAYFIVGGVSLELEFQLFILSFHICLLGFPSLIRACVNMCARVLVSLRECVCERARVRVFLYNFACVCTVRCWSERFVKYARACVCVERVFAVLCVRARACSSLSRAVCCSSSAFLNSRRCPKYGPRKELLRFDILVTTRISSRFDCKFLVT